MLSRRLKYILIILTLLWGANLRAEAISRIVINLPETPTKGVSKEQIEKVLPIKPGDEYSPQKLDEAVTFLSKWGVFEEINAATEQESGGMVVKFHLKPAVLFGEIVIDGNYPYIEKKITKYLTIRPGDMYNKEKVEEQIKRIKDFYARQGYINTSVTAKEEWSEYTNDIIVTFKIRHGQVFRYRDINVTGMNAYPKGRLVSYINTYFHYTQRRLADGLRKLEDFYKKHGYYRAQVKAEEKTFDYDNDRIDLNVTVNEGPKVDIDFIGRKTISAKKLRLALTFYDEGSFDEYEIEASIDNLLKLYRRYGFDKTTITYKRKQQGEGDYLIQFFIVEGERQRIKTIEFAGNKGISSGKLRKQMETKELSLTKPGIYNEKVLARDTEALKKYYDSEGYIKARIETPVVDKERDGIFIEIPVVEDGQTTIKGIVFEGNKSFKERRLLKKLRSKVGRPYNPNIQQDEKNAIYSFLADHGHPYAEVEQEVKVEGKDAYIIYRINEGNPVKIGEVLIVGNSLTASNSIRRAVGLRTGDPFSVDKITNSELALRRMGAFTSARIETIGLTEKESTVHLKVKVEEQKPFLVDVGVSYSTWQGITGSLNFVNLNSFGYAKRSSLSLTGGRKLSRGEVAWSDPRFLGTDLEMTASSWLQYENQNVFSYIQGAGGFGIFRRYHRTGLMAKYEVDRNYFIKGDSTAADAYSLRDNTLSKLSLSASFDTRNSFSDPTRGIFTMLSTDFTNEIKGRQANYVKIRYAFGNYYGFWNYFTFSNNARLDQIQTFGTNVSVPSNDLYLLGGDDTIRGFTQYSLGPVNAAGKPTGGRVRWVYNGELMLKVYGNFKVAGFYDVGAMENSFDQLDLASIKQSAGAGLRYFTPVGPVKLDYGIVVNRKPGENFGRLHFTFGYVF